MANPEFFDVADKFIHLANELSKKWPTTRISAAIMYASARYNAFNFFVKDGKDETQQKAIEYYCEQYKKMLKENMANIQKEFEEKGNDSVM
ncbi:MAG TPA: DUF3144 domain-containing protein [Terriglobales bacterium]|nr:DUF3144 domain-containing protein [Terriglobales bacterium]